MVTIRFSLDNEFALFLLIPTVLSSGQVGGKQSFLYIDSQSAWVLAFWFLPFRFGRAYMRHGKEMGMTALESVSATGDFDM